MKKIKILFSCLLMLSAVSVGFGQQRIDPVTNYYNTPDTINFNGVVYKLAWSSHPNNSYYKHEYLPNGENPNHFNTMLMVDFIVGDFNAEDAAKAQIKKLQDRKKTDKLCNYDMIESPDHKEFIIDFLMSETKDAKLNIVEWNAYHYKLYTDKAGHKVVMLFAISHRGYGDETGDFMKSLSTYRNINRSALISHPIPEIQIN